MEYSLDIVIGKIQTKEFHVHSIRPKDVSTRRNLDIYEVFYLVYDQRNDIILNYFACSKCKQLLFCNLAQNGNSTLTRHSCYKKYLTEKKERLENEELEKKEKIKDENKTSKSKVYVDLIDESDDEFLSNNDVTNSVDEMKNGPRSTVSTFDRELLVTAFAGYGKVCAQFGALNPQQLKTIMPTDFDNVKW